MPASHTDDGLVDCCPECQSVHEVHERRRTEGVGGSEGSEQYACHRCGATFDEKGTKERPPQTGAAAPKHAAARALLEADPDAVGGERV